MPHAGNRQQGLTWRPTKAHLKACQALLECQISLTCNFIRPYLNCQISLTWFSFRPYLNCLINLTWFSFRPYLNCLIRFTCLSFKPYLNCQISLTCNFIRPYMNCQIRFTCLSFRAPHELSDKAHLIFFQTLPESRNVQNSFEFYPPPPHGIQLKNNLHSEEENGRKSPTLSRWNYFTNRNAVSKYFLSNILYFHFFFSVVLRRLSVFFECPDPLLSYTVILPPLRSFSLFCRRFPSHFSPVPATGFLCLFSCFPAVEKSQNNVSENIKTYIYKNKFISLFSYLSAQIFFYYNLHLLI